ncbi:hypothetical protein TNCV_1056061 [Trichonephila clavipes]|nr:hypothetical protein TNCV_1056061 [Trichonephila clavipes]
MPVHGFLTICLPVWTDDVVIRVFTESRAFEQMVAIRYGMATELEGLGSLSRYLGGGTTVSRVSIDEEPLNNACHVWSRIILLKYVCGQALKVRKDNWFQHLGDVALAV